MANECMRVWMPELIINIWNNKLNKELTKWAAIGVDPRSSSVSFVEDKSWLWHSFSVDWRQNIEHDEETAGLASVKWCRSARSLFVLSHWAQAAWYLVKRQEKLRVIPPTFLSWRQETDPKTSRDAGLWISLPVVTSLAWSWTKAGRLATVWWISIRVVIWLWWVQKRLVTVVDPITQWQTNIEFIDRIFISRGMVIQVGLEGITLPIFSVPLQIRLGGEATSHKVQNVAKKSGRR